MFCAQTVSFRRRMPPAAYDWISLVVVREGTGQAILTGDAPPVVLRPGVVLMARPHTPVGMRPHGTLVASWVFCAPEFLWDHIRRRQPAPGGDILSAQALSDGPLAQPFQTADLPDDAVGPVHRFLDELAGLTDRRLIQTEYFQAQHWLMGVLGVVMPLLDTSRAPSAGTVGQICQPSLPGLGRVKYLAPPVVKALGWMEAHYRESWAVAELAAVVGMSTSGLTKAFNVMLGRPPLRVRDDFRLVTFARLLVLTSMSVKAASAAVGWATPERAAAKFRAATGMTPGVWRRNRIQPYPGGDTPTDSLLKPTYPTRFGV